MEEVEGVKVRNIMLLNVARLVDFLRTKKLVIFYSFFKKKKKAQLTSGITIFRVAS